MDAIQTWLYRSPLGNIVKVLAGTLLGYVAATLPSWRGDLAPVVFIVVQALVPVLINYLNGADPRMGRGKAKTLHEPHDIFDEGDN